MKVFRGIAIAMLVVLALASAGARWIAPNDYAAQDREAPSVAPSHQYLLGTDDLGRDRFSRLLYGTQVSLLLAPAAALISVMLAALIGGVAGFVGGRWERFAMGFTDLVLSLPWLFLLITVRAALPLNTSAWTSVFITF